MIFIIRWVTCVVYYVSSMGICMHYLRDVSKTNFTTLSCLQVCKVKLAAFLSIQFSVLCVSGRGHSQSGHLQNESLCVRLSHDMYRGTSVLCSAQVNFMAACNIRGGNIITEIQYI